MEATARGRPEAVDAVKVVVRVRPLNAKERQEQTKSCVRIASSPDGLSSNNRADADGGPQQLIVGKDRAFTFDEVFGIDSSQQDVYKHNVEALVDCFLEGYNATVLAYGQTGTGKTHTMSGSSIDPKGAKHDDQQGIIPRVIRAIFEKMQANQQRREYSLRVEYIEIYNEELRDLLHPETPSKQLSIREDAEGNIIMAGVKSETAQSKEAVFRFLSLGGASRVTGSTMMNEQSSRSHAIFSLIVQQRDLATGECRKAKFHLVDLAGSERAKRTGAVAGRFKESISINQGLLALGNVISALSDEKRKLGATEKPSTSGGGGGVHVPYRDSKLTRLLQDSLGGNAKTLMIACVSPATMNFEETLNTLKYANRAKNIKNRPIVNQQTQEEKQRADDEIARMKEEIALLQSQLLVSKPPATPSTAGSSSSRPETTSSSRSRRHSVAVSTSTANMGQDAVATEQKLTHLRKKCRAYADTIETMRELNVEAITSLVAMERDIKPLGRPVQQRLNEIVKTLNAAVQAVGSVEASLRKSLSLVPGGGEVASHGNAASDGEVAADVHARVAKELKEAKANLARDEQIFEMKNAEIKRLQTFVTEAKIKNEKLIQRVQELERSGQLWTNQGPVASVALVHPSPSKGEVRRSRQGDAMTVPPPPPPTSSSSVEALPPRGDVDAKRSSSSRGLFMKRTGTAMGFEPQEDNVLIGNDDDDDTATHRSRDPKAKPTTASRRSVGSSATHRSSLSGAVASRESHDNGTAVSKMEKMLATLCGKVEELQQQNSELQHGREEAFRRWQLERQQYERQVSEAEQTIEALRAAKQALEDTLIDDKHESHVKASVEVRGSHTKSGKQQQQSSSDIVMDEHGVVVSELALPATTRRPKTATVASMSPADVVELFDSSIRRLMEYNQARQQVLQLVKDKKTAQHTVDEASKRLSALEMQKMRQSLSLRESIADVAKSLRSIDDKMQRDEHRSVEEIERLTKLKDRAERKLRALRRQEEREEFLDQDAQQEAADLEELIEDLNSHIAFQDAELAAARDEMELVRQRAQLEQQSPLDALAQAAVERLGLEAAYTAATTALLKKCFEEAARLRTREQELQAELAERGAALSERDAALDHLETGLEASRKEFDRRLQLQRQESHEVVSELERAIARLRAELEAKRQPLEPEQADSESAKDEEWQKLIISCQKKDAYITDLEKHVVFYKAKAKQMQGQLQQLIRDSAGNQDDASDHEEQQQLQKRVQQLEAANDALMKDLATAKVYLQLSKSRGSHDGAQVVRISKSELRELPRPPTAVSCRDEDE